MALSARHLFASLLVSAAVFSSPASPAKTEAPGAPATTKPGTANAPEPPPAAPPAPPRQTNAPKLTVAANTTNPPSPANSAKPCLKLQLAWGTDDDTPPKGKNYKELDPSLKDRLRHLRWKNYFVVNHAVTKPITTKPQRFELSDKCAIEVGDHGNGQASITIMNLRPGQTASLVKTEFFSFDKLGGGHAFVYGGESKDRTDDAWLVIVTATP